MESIWHRIPFLRLVIALLIGAATGYNLPEDSVLFYLIIGMGITLMAILLGFAKRWKIHGNQLVFGVLLASTFFFVGIGLTLSQKIRNAERILLPGKAESFVAEVIEYPQKKENSVRLILKLNQKKYDSEFHPIPKVDILAYSPFSLNLDTLIPGDLVYFFESPKAHQKPINPGQFDYGRYLQKNGIAGTVYFHNDILAYRPGSTSWSLSGFFLSVQNYCIQVFKNHDLGPRELGVSSALILGQRSLLLPDTRDAFANAGAIHVLAVSGLHVGIIYLALVGIFSRIFPGKRWQIFNLILILLVLWFYAGVTGFSPSVLRAATMFSFIAIGKHSGHKANIYNMLAASAFLLIIINPGIIAEVGFQLSYLAVIGIVFFFQPIYGLLIFKSWLPDKIWSLLVVSFTAQLATFPITIFYFGQFPNYFLLANLIVIPGAMLSLWAGLILILVQAIPILNAIVAIVLKLVLRTLITFIEWISSLPYALSENLYFGLGAVLLIYLLIMLIVHTYRNPGRGNIWFPLTVMLILSVMWAHRKITIANTIQFGVLDGGKSSVVIMQQGRNSYAVTKEFDEKTPSKSQFYLNGHFLKTGIENVEWKELNKDFENEYMAIKSRTVYYNGFTISYLDPDYRESSFRNSIADFIVISKGIKPHQIPIENENVFYVIDTSVSDYYRSQIIAYLIKHEVPFWDMHYQGPLFAERQKFN